MKRLRLKRLSLVMLVMLFTNMIALEPVFAVSGSGATRQIPSSGTANLGAVQTATGSDGVQFPEFINEAEGDTEGAGTPAAGPIVNDRSMSGNASNSNSPFATGNKTKSNPTAGLSFNGLNFRQQRLANGGNQFSVEPPDQALCAGAGSVVEAVNDVVRVFDTSGNPKTGVVDLNTFYGYIPAINRTTGAYGPELTDPVCHFDTDTQKFYLAVLTLDRVGTSSRLSLKNHLDLAVSQTADPTGAWKIYKIDATDDGTNGTPSHNDCPCIGDYPHIGADANGIYLTTNEYPWLTDGYNGSQIYAMSKWALASLPASIAVTQLDTNGTVAGVVNGVPVSYPGFTVWPAVAPAGQNSTANGGTEYFMSSNAGAEAKFRNDNYDDYTGQSNQLIVWKLTNTSSLNSANPALTLTNNILPVETYAIPPQADQKAGDFPLGQCLNIPACATTYILGAPDPYVETLSKLDANDTRMQQVFYANGKLWGALDTAITVNGANKAGIAWFIVNPNAGSVVKQGYLALANNNLTYPAIAVSSSGRGIMAFTLVGADHYPSAAYASIDALSGTGDIVVAAEGLGPQDGFTGYKGLVGDPPRPRWGDYGAAALDGNTIWMASEYIAQTCTLSQYLTAPIGSCGGTRASLGNWATRITSVGIK